MDTNFLDIINILVIFQCSIFSIFLVQRRNRKPANIFLAVFLLSQALVSFHLLCRYHQEYFASSVPYLYFIGTPFYFLISPSLFLYTKSLAFSNYRFTKSQLVHLLPLFIVAIFFILTFHIHSNETKRILIEHGFFKNYYFYLIFTLLFFVQIAAYCIWSLILIRRYRKIIKQECSSIASINLSWLTFFLYGYLLSWCTSILFFLQVILFSNPSVTLQFINNLAFFIFLNLIFYKGLLQPELFSGVEEKPKYSTSKLNRTDADTYSMLLASYMETKKPYLNPTITLKELSDELSIPPRFLSQVINEYYHKNFFDFMNQHRIEAAKQLFNDPVHANKTVLQILYEVGFNSKSSFNIAFKKVVGMTPSQYRQLHGRRELI